MRPLYLLVLDVGLVLAAALAALALRDNLEFSAQRTLDMLPYLFFALMAAAMVFPLAGTNRGVWRYSTFNDFLRIGAAAVVIVLTATSVTFAYNRLDGLARTIPILHLILIVVFMCALRVAMRLHHSRRSRPRVVPALMAAQHVESVLIVGVNAVSALFVRSVRDFASDSIQIVGLLGAADRHRGRALDGVPIVGAPEDLAEVLRQLEVHGVTVQRIVVAAVQAELSRSVLEALQEIEDGSSIVVDYFSERLGFSAGPPAGRSLPSIPTPADDEAARLPSLQHLVRCHSLVRPYWNGKRLLDAAAALIMLTLSAPIMLLVAIVVAVDVGAPVLFWQERPGMFGRRLRLYKFRTMRSAHAADGTRIPEEARLSAIGRFLRRSRLDELPQLFHILLGDMSFVGPRPLLSAEQPPSHSARLAVRPGLTGWAQVNGGRSISTADKAAMDLWYIRNASFRLDASIAVKTLGMILHGDKADERAIAAAWINAAAWKRQLASSRELVGLDESPTVRGAA